MARKDKKGMPAKAQRLSGSKAAGMRKEYFSGAFYFLGMYLAMSQWMLPGIVSLIMGTIILRYKKLKNHNAIPKPDEKGSIPSGGQAT